MTHAHPVEQALVFLLGVAQRQADPAIHAQATQLLSLFFVQAAADTSLVQHDDPEHDDALSRDVLAPFPGEKGSLVDPAAPAEENPASRAD